VVNRPINVASARTRVQDPTVATPRLWTQPERHGQAVGQVTMTSPPEYHGPHAAGRQLGAEEVRVTDRLDLGVIVKEPTDSACERRRSCG
jgi:hypothetical protein